MKMAILRYRENVEYYCARVYYDACHKLANLLRLRNGSFTGACTGTSLGQEHLLQKILPSFYGKKIISPSFYSKKRILPSFYGKKRMGQDRTYENVIV